MKVVMDAVFNHTGKEFFAFKDILERAEKSKYLDWYYIDELPLKKGEWGEFRTSCVWVLWWNAKAESEKSRGCKLHYGRCMLLDQECDIDGWRLDVGDEISHFF